MGLGKRDMGERGYGAEPGGSQVVRELNWEKLLFHSWKSQSVLLNIVTVWGVLGDAGFKRV